MELVDLMSEIQRVTIKEEDNQEVSALLHSESYTMNLVFYSSVYDNSKNSGGCHLAALGTGLLMF